MRSGIKFGRKWWKKWWWKIVIIIALIILGLYIYWVWEYGTYGGLPSSHLLMSMING